MKSKSIQLAFKWDDISLPNFVTTRSGVIFNPNKSRWAYRDGCLTMSMNFSSLNGISNQLLLGVKKTLIWYAENMSPSHTVNMFHFMKHFFRIISSNVSLSEVTSVDILNYRSRLGENSRWRVSSLAGFFKRWYDLKIPGVSKDVVDLLRDIRLKGCNKGAAVLTMDPFIGPFTNLERNALHVALDSSFVRGDLDIADYLLGALVAIFGQRTSQYSYLKVCDVLNEKRYDGTSVVVLRIPRAKQRGQLPRSDFKERALIPQVGTLLVNYAENVEKAFVGRLKDPRQAPLFPDTRELSDYQGGLEFHRTSGWVKERVKNVFENLNVHSERTGELMNIAPIRFRRTLGTQAAIEGHGPLVIAELLDHSDLQNVGVYVSATPEIIERIDRAVAIKLAPLAQAFAGILVDAKAEQDIPHGLRITAPKQSKDFSPVGSCGQHGFCGFAAPIACYTCSSFRAWLDGPHEEILEYLVAERDRLMSVDVRIASVNDRTILAIAQVVEMCENAQRGIESNV